MGEKRLTIESSPAARSRYRGPACRKAGRRLLAAVIVGVVAYGIAACSRPRGATAEDKRAQVRQMRSDLLAEFYRADPSLRTKVGSSAGYGAFSNTGFKFLVVGSAHGYGVVRDNRTGKDTFMRMGQLAGGLGFGAKNFLVLFVFRNQQALRDFVERGWQVGGEAEGTAIAGDVGLTAGAQAKASGGGAAAGGSGKAGKVTGRSYGSGIEVYRLTRVGAALEATVAGTKYWKDKSLN
jgi:lipid-binding SYLF domain-containing protein